MAPDHALFPPSPFAELAVAIFQQVARCNVDPIDRHLRAALTDVRARNSMLSKCGCTNLIQMINLVLTMTLAFTD